MTMRLNPTYQNHLKDWIKGSIIVYGILVLLYFISLIFIAVYVTDSSDIGGLESVPMIFILVAGISTFKPNLKLALANGISRKTEFTSSLLAALTMSVIFVILNIGVSALYSITYDYFSIFNAKYGINYFPSGGFMNILFELIYNAACNFASFLIGYFIGALYYRMSKGLKILVSVGVPVIVFIGIPSAIAAFDENSFFIKVVNAIVIFFGKIDRNPYYSIIESIIEIAILIILSFLLIRRAPINEQG